MSARMVKTEKGQSLKLKTPKGVKVEVELPQTTRTLRVEELNQYNVNTAIIEAVIDAKFTALEAKLDRVISALKIKEAA